MPAGPNQGKGEMPEEQTTTETTVATETKETEGGEGRKAQDGLTADLVKERKARQTAEKASAEYQKRLAALEDAGKSEMERLTERASQAEKAAEEANSRYLRLKVGATAGLPPSLAERLQGNDEDEMLDDAKRLQEALISSGAKAPADAFDARRNSGDAGGEPDVNSLIRERMKR